MKKTFKLRLFMCLILLASAIMLTACNNSNDNPTPEDDTTDSHVHTEAIDSAALPTCTETGLTEGKHCSVCGEILVAQDVVPSLGHTEVIDKAVEPACSETGLTEGKHCSVCDETLIAQEIIPELGHTEVVDKAVEPTCAKTGLTEGKHCSVCGEVLVAQEIISNSSIEHNYTLVSTPPTAAEDGHIKDTCSVCGDVRTEEVITATDFTVTSGNRAQVGYTGETGENLVIPAVFEKDGAWYRVVGIDTRAFYGCSNITSITIPDSVTGIGSGAFENCYRLASITIPFVGTTKDGTENTHFGYIFGASNFVSNGIYIPPYLKNVVITGGSKISASAFYSCSGLTSITIPNSVTEIGYHAFRYCSDLTSITISDSITKIGFGAFDGCNAFKDVYITDLAGWCAISFDTFDSNPLHCGGNLYLNGELLTEVVIPDGITAVGSHTFHGCKSIETVSIPGSVTGIGTFAFFDCTNLTSVTVPNSVTIIDSDAFYGCINLTSITIPCNVTSIGLGAFENCISLTSITIPDSVTKLGANVFKNCTGLTSIVIPNSVSSIGQGALSGCTGLTNISIPFVGASKDDEKNAHFRYIFGAYSYYDEGGLIPESLKTVVVTGGNRISGCAFYCCDSLTSITLPDSITIIDAKAFINCTGLTSITIPSSVSSIHYSAFSGCTGLRDVTFGKNSELTSIYHSAFYGCVGLTSITLPESLTSIEYDVFEGCVNMTSITLPFAGATKDGISNMHFGYIFGAPYSTDNADYVPTSLKTVVITNCTSIGSNAFRACENLTSITLPESVTSIGSYAFYECNSLTSIHITNLANWCAIKFSGNYANPLHCADGLYLNGELVTEAVIPDGATTISSLAFYDYERLTSITIPSSVTSIGSNAFSNCTGLKSITIPDSVTSIGSSAFYKCTNLESITIPFVGENKDGTSKTNFGCIFGANDYSTHSSNVPASLKTVVVTGGTSIATWAFRYCENIESITILDGVTSIGQYAFSRCTGLKSITLPDTLTKIEQYAFDGSSGLESITIPSSVTSIGIGTFQGCTGLTSIVIPFVGATEDSTENQHLGYIFGTPSYYSNDNHVPASLKSIVITDSASIGAQAFYNCSNIESVRIAKSVTKIGYYAFSGCTGLTSITFDGTVEEWNAVEIGHSWKNNIPATEVVCSDGAVKLS